MHIDAVKTISWLLCRRAGADLLEINDHLMRLPWDGKEASTLNREELFAFCVREGLWLKIAKYADGCRYYALDLHGITELLHRKPV
jgi:hypothetical protein